VSRAVAVLRDPELVELLADEPELLAIADAIAATAHAGQRRSGRSPIVIPLIALLAAAVLALAAPWSNSRGGVIQKALAAVSTNSVLHVVLVSQIPGTTTVDLKTGRTTQASLRVEQWFDAKRSLKSYTMSRNGATDAFLETPNGVWSSAGRVPTCSWIAAHPIKATKLRVSCSESGRNGTTPRQVPESRPTGDPALSAFLSGYRSALRSGAARNLGAGKVGTTPVFWIGFSVKGSHPAQTERVAVAKMSFRPVLFETTVNGKVSTRARVVTIETVAFARSLFSRPTAHTQLTPSAGEVAKTKHVPLRIAEAALGGAARSLGHTFASLPLIDARIDDLTTGYGPLSGKRVTHAPGVQLIYGDADIASNTPFLRISEALSPQMAYGMQTNRAPLPGSLVLTEIRNETAPLHANGSGWKCYAPVCGNQSLWFGQMRLGSLYLALETSSRSLILEAARSLEKAQ
jgi:hypothetical protein